MSISNLFTYLLKSYLLRKGQTYKTVAKNKSTLATWEHVIVLLSSIISYNILLHMATS